MSLKNIIILLLVLMLLGVLPVWEHSAAFGYEPTGALLIIILLLIIFKVL